MDRVERIIKYIENELTYSERSAFEEKLKTSSELRNELDKYLKVKVDTSKLKNIKLTSAYLDSIIPEFRDKIQTIKAPSVNQKLSYAFVTLIAIIISFALLSYLFSDNALNNDLPEFANSLNENQKIELLENLNGETYLPEVIAENVSVDEINELINSELDLSTEVFETYELTYDELIVGLGKNEIDKIYNEIMNLNF